MLNREIIVSLLNDNKKAVQKDRENKREKIVKNIPQPLSVIIRYAKK